MSTWLRLPSSSATFFCALFCCCRCLALLCSIAICNNTREGGIRINPTLTLSPIYPSLLTFFCSSPILIASFAVLSRKSCRTILSDGVGAFLCLFLRFFLTGRRLPVPLDSRTSPSANRVTGRLFRARGDSKSESAADIPSKANFPNSLKTLKSAGFSL